MENPNIADPSIRMALDEHLFNVKNLIMIRLDELNKSSVSDNSEDVKQQIEKRALSISNLNQAIKQYIKLGDTENVKTGMERFFELFPPFTLICFIMTLAFGGLGEIVKGMDFIDKVCAVKVNKDGNPDKEVWMKITVLSDREVAKELKTM